ncbi:MAG: hypothetical protein AAF702_44650 [Chloroflexota bacterium]
MNLISDYFTDQPARNFCQCGQTLAFGAVACMPIESVEPLAIAIIEMRQGATGKAFWSPAVVDPRDDSIVDGLGNRYWSATPCEALRAAVRISHDRKMAIRQALFQTRPMDWHLLIEKVSKELYARGYEARLDGKPAPRADYVHPLVTLGYTRATLDSETVLAESEEQLSVGVGLRWEVAHA